MSGCVTLHYISGCKFSNKIRVEFYGLAVKAGNRPIASSSALDFLDGNNMTLWTPSASKMAGCRFEFIGYPIYGALLTISEVMVGLSGIALYAYT